MIRKFVFCLSALFLAGQVLGPDASAAREAPLPEKDPVALKKPTGVRSGDGFWNKVGAQFQKTRVRARFRLLDATDGIRRWGSRLQQSVPKRDTESRVASRRSVGTQYERAMFHFINARNNLEPYAHIDFAEIVEGSRGDLKTVHVVQLGTLSATNATRVKVHNGNVEEIASLSGVDFGSVSDAKAFFKWGMTATDRDGQLLFSAKQYDFNFWNHGGGHAGDMFDDKTRSHMALSEFQDAFPQKMTGGLCLLDMCLAGNIEHAAALAVRRDRSGRKGAPAVRVLVAAEETEPGAGHDYLGAAAALAKIPSGDLRAQGKAWVSAYVQAYSDGSHGTSTVQDAAIDVQGVADLLPRMRVFARELVAAARGGERQTLLNQAVRTQRFYLASQRDLGHFAQLVAENSARPALKTAAEEIVRFLKQKVVISNQLSKNNTKHKDSTGMAIYLPTPTSLTEDKRTLLDIANGVYPPGYAGHRITELSSWNVAQLQRQASDYLQTTFAKEVPEWVEFIGVINQKGSLSHGTPLPF